LRFKAPEYSKYAFKRLPKKPVPKARALRRLGKKQVCLQVLRRFKQQPSNACDKFVLKKPIRTSRGGIMISSILLKLGKSIMDFHLKLIGKINNDIKLSKKNVKQ
jgi:hypothetical protein